MLLAVKCRSIFKSVYDLDKVNDWIYKLDSGAPLNVTGCIALIFPILSRKDFSTNFDDRMLSILLSSAAFRNGTGLNLI